MVDRCVSPDGAIKPVGVIVLSREGAKASEMLVEIRACDDGGEFS